jgi:hypothetical protein
MDLFEAGSQQPGPDPFLDIVVSDLNSQSHRAIEGDI